MTSRQRARARLNPAEQLAARPGTTASPPSLEHRGPQGHRIASAPDGSWRRPSRGDANIDPVRTRSSADAVIVALRHRRTPRPVELPEQAARSGCSNASGRSSRRPTSPRMAAAPGGTTPHAGAAREARPLDIRHRAAQRPPRCSASQSWMRLQGLFVDDLEGRAHPARAAGAAQLMRKRWLPDGRLRTASRPACRSTTCPW